MMSNGSRNANAAAIPKKTWEKEIQASAKYDNLVLETRLKCPADINID